MTPRFMVKQADQADEASTSRTLTLTAGDWRAEVRPALGGAITALEHRRRPILRPTPADADNILQTACFPLVPYANRIADGTFEFDGRRIRLPIPPGFAPHAIHGDGWRSAWRIDHADDHSARLSLEWGGDPTGWAWPWLAVQTFVLTDIGLDATLSLTNTSGEPMPAGLGFHPYFPRSSATRLQFEADAVWLTDERNLPRALARTERVRDWRGGAEIDDGGSVDHAYAAWTGEARVSQTDLAPTLAASPNARWLQVYAPAGEDFLCVEPTTHRPNALNASSEEDAGLVRLAPDSTLTLEMRIRRRERDAR